MASSSARAHLEGNAQLDQRLDAAQARLHVLAAGAARQIGSARPSSTSEASQPNGPRKSTTRRAASMRAQRALGFLFDLLPAGFGDRRAFAEKMVRHLRHLFLRARRLPMPRLPSRLRAASLPPFRRRPALHHLGLDLGDRAFGEQESLEVLRQLGIAAAKPFQRHRRVLLLLVAIVLEDGAQIGIACGLGALVVPVDGLQLFHQGHDGAMGIDRLGADHLGAS